MAYLGLIPPSVVARKYFRFTITAAGTTPTLSGNDDFSNTLAYNTGYIYLFKNRTKMVDTNDYTATNGSSITFTVPLVSGDVVEVFSDTLNTFSVMGVDTYLYDYIHNHFGAL